MEAIISITDALSIVIVLVVESIVAFAFPDVYVIAGIVSLTPAGIVTVAGKKVYELFTNSASLDGNMSLGNVMTG